MRIAQLSDCHMTAPGELVADRVDPGPQLDAAVAALNRIEGIALVIGTGDLANTGLAAEYDRLERSLEALAAPFLPIPGNHDDRSELRRRWDLPSGDPDEPIDHVIELDGVRVVCLDTTMPGRHDGELSEAQWVWLDEQLDSESPAVVAQHHPPFPSGLPFMDGPYPLQMGERECDLIVRHPNVRAVWAGHVHRHAQTVIGSALASTCPSTAVSLAAAFGQVRTVYSDEPCGVLIHDLDGTGCVTRLVALGEQRRWTPDWAAD